MGGAAAVKRDVVETQLIDDDNKDVGWPVVTGRFGWALLPRDFLKVTHRIHNPGNDARQVIPVLGKQPASSNDD